MAQLRTIISGATRTPHLAARPAATVLAEYRPNPDSDLRGAVCAGVDTALFFPDPDEIGAAAAEWAERRAKMICAGCPVKSLCLADALERREPHGIFGGLNERERNRVLRRAARDRSRVNAGGVG
ncbi:WhiB family transcriptional regulator [Kitasatospora sp. NPDC001539]|uniref:WhiB family transcriptional regulator n=1 Tax=Kitasatospora sp. NPDC001539 TaxID=3154384 RepID=UPI003332B2E0